MISPTYPNESSGITDWKKNTGRAIRTNGCVCFLCTSGEASVSLNLHKTSFGKGDLAIITSDVYFSVAEISADFSTCYVALSETVIETAYYRITDATFWEYLHHEPILKLSSEQFRLMSGWMDQIHWILSNISATNLMTLINNNVYNLFIAIRTELDKKLKDKSRIYKNSAWEITTRFWSLLTRHSHKERSVHFYANALSITPDYLNKVCHRAYGITPKAFIDQQIILEIKSYLLETTLTVAEIAERLNFEDASYMCRFFRRKTGLSPLEFRKQN